MPRNRFISATSLAILFSAVALGFLPCQASGEPFKYPEKKSGKGELKYINSLPVLMVEGKPDEIGGQVADLACKPGEKILDYPKDLLKRFKTEFAWNMFVKAGTGMLKQFPDDHLKELEAMAKAGVNREQLVVGNTIFDIKKSLACSAQVVEADRSATGKVLVGRNLDYPSLDYAHEYSLVTIYKTDGKHAFAAIGFPGLVGCLSGMNDAGLCLGVLEIYTVKEGTKRFDEKGTPYMLCYRRLLEECTTVAEAEKLLKSMKRTTLNCLVVADKDGGAVFEISPEDVVVRKSTEGQCSCTNHFCTKEMKPEKQENLFRSVDRFKTLEKTRELQKVDVAEMHKALHACSHKGSTMQTMVFEPSELKLHLAIGKVPASEGELKTLELAPLFKKK